MYTIYISQRDPTIPRVRYGQSSLRAPQFETAPVAHTARGPLGLGGKVPYWATSIALTAVKLGGLGGMLLLFFRTDTDPSHSGYIVSPE